MSLFPDILQHIQPHTRSTSITFSVGVIVGMYFAFTATSKTKCNSNCIQTFSQNLFSVNTIERKDYRFRGHDFDGSKTARNHEENETPRSDKCIIQLLIDYSDRFIVVFNPTVFEFQARTPWLENFTNVFEWSAGLWLAPATTRERRNT